MQLRTRSLWQKRKVKKEEEKGGGGIPNGIGTFLAVRTEQQICGMQHPILFEEEEEEEKTLSSLGVERNKRT